MSTGAASQGIDAREVEVRASDLPLHCPPPGAPVWRMHPRVFLDVTQSADGTILCPYCGTKYVFKGPAGAGH